MIVLWLCCVCYDCVASVLKLCCVCNGFVWCLFSGVSCLCCVRCGCCVCVTVCVVVGLGLW